MRLCILILLSLACHLGSLVKGDEEPIPVLLWSPEKRMSDHEDSAANLVESDELHEKFLKPLMGDMAAVVFLQDKLHADDFTHFADVYSLDGQGGAFANIKTLMEDNFSLEIPQVSSPFESVDKLRAKFAGNVHTVSSLLDLDHLNLSPTSGSFLLIVQLKPTEGSADREDALRQNDEMIGEVCKHLNKRSVQYTAAFTGMAPAEAVNSEGAIHSGRHLMADPQPTANGTLMNITNGGQALLFMRDIYICVKNKDKPDCVSNFTLIPTEKSADTSVIANNTATINLVFNKEKSGDDTFDIKIIMESVNQGDRWAISRVALFVTPEDPKKNGSSIENGTLSPGEMDFKVPILYSFHCTKMKMDLYSLTDFSSFKGTYVSFSGFQFQPFKVQKDRFFNSVDCVPFFTSAIWMGLFPALLLLIILLYGSQMLLNLSIMDRYDDPKGKTITVAQASSD